MTRCLVVVAHPLTESLSQRIAATAADLAGRAGWDVHVRDLYREGFDPILTPAERSSYYKDFQGEARAEMAELAQVDVVILVFPTWWFGFPAVLKGWFDRVWVPGVAYDHRPDLGPMVPRLHGLRAVLALTTMGAPGWVDWLVMRRPLRRILTLGIVRPCAPRARVLWRGLYQAEAVSPDRLARFEARMARDIARLAGWV